MRRRISSKSDTCTERAGVYATGISEKAGAHYPGRSAILPEMAIAAVRSRNEIAEVSRGHSSRAIDEGLNLSKEADRISVAHA